MFEGFYKILNYIYLIDYAFSNLPALPFGRQAAGKCVIWVKSLQEDVPLFSLTQLLLSCQYS